LSVLAHIFFYLSGFNLLLLTTAALGWKRSLASRWLCLAALFFSAIFSSSAAARALVWALENRYPDHGIESLPRAQAIVVLGGAYHAPGDSINPTDRLLYALQLYRVGRAPLVICTGGGLPNEANEAELMGRLLQKWGVPPAAILTEGRSLSTWENALFSSPVLKARGIRQILLVTSALHMPRAAAVFRKVGFEVIPAPTDFQKRGAPGGRLFPNAYDLEWSDQALREWVGLLVYRLRGWV